MRNKFNNKGKSFLAQILIASIGFALAFIFSCSSEGNDPGNSSSSGNSSGGSTFRDDRDTKSYKLIEIGEQTWMAENLNYRGIEPDTLGVCYGNDPDNCAKYGRLYTWASAINVCPDGWHLPSEEEWNKLEASVSNIFGCLSSIGRCLKSKDGWYDNGNGIGNGTDMLGFNVLPSGVRWSDGEFDEEGKSAYFWGSSDEQEFPWGLEDWGYYRKIGYNSYGHGYDEKTYMFSVRCLKK